MDRKPAPRLKELCDAYGVMLEFLPLYSPDFNPIEATFHDLKAWIRRNNQLASDYGDFGGFLEYAVSQGGGMRRHIIERQDMLLTDFFLY